MLSPWVDVVSSWLWSAEPDYPVADEQALGYAECDVDEVLSSEVLILDTIDESTTGGREVEFGMAGAWGKHCIIVGPYRNVFHRLAHEHYESWDDYFAQNKVDGAELAK